MRHTHTKWTEYAQSKFFIKRQKAVSDSFAPVTHINKWATLIIGFVKPIATESFQALSYLWKLYNLSSLTC